MKRFSFLGFVLCAAILSGCKQGNTPGAGSTSTSRASATGTTSGVHQYPTAAQAKLATIKLWIGSQEMNTEMALTPIQEETGMMYRTNMAENEGMIFVFPQPTQAQFWMKNTLLPLSCAYISPDGTIQEIHDMQPKDETTITSRGSNIQYVLETRQGWFKRNNIGVGTVITTEHGPLNKVFITTQ